MDRKRILKFLNYKFFPATAFFGRCNLLLLIVLIVSMSLGTEIAFGQTPLHNKKMESVKQKEKKKRRQLSEKKKPTIRDKKVDVKYSKPRENTKDEGMKVRYSKPSGRIKDEDVNVRYSRPKKKTRDTRKLDSPQLEEREHAYDFKRREKERPQKLKYDGLSSKGSKENNPSKQEASFSGNHSINPNKKTKTQGTTYEGDYKVAASKKKKTKGPNYEGDFKAPSAKASDRFYGKRSEEMHQYQGSLRVKKIDKKEAHPSAEYRGGKMKNSREKKEKLRKRKIWWSRFKKNSDQPKHLKDKPKKPKYDSRENEIWYE